MIHTKHNPAHCEVCAAQQEADALGAIPTAGHLSDDRLLQQQAEGVARAVQAMTGASDNAAAELWRRLYAFANEIKRQTIEP